MSQAHFLSPAWALRAVTSSIGRGENALGAWALNQGFSLRSSAHAPVL